MARHPGGASLKHSGPSRIVGTGAYLPETALSSATLERRLRLQAGTLEEFLGVRERRIAPAHEAVSDLAVPAARAAIASSGLAPSRIGLTILATSTPDHPVPATAPQVAHRLGVKGPAFDLMNTCSGWLYALATADAHLAAGTAEAALVVGANVLSRRLDWAGDWSTAGLFGDGAGAVVLAREPTPEAAEAHPVHSGHPQSVHPLHPQSVHPQHVRPQPNDPPPVHSLEKAPRLGAKLIATALDADGEGWERIQVPAGGSRNPITAEALAGGQHLLRIERHPGMLREAADMLCATARAALAKAGLGTHDVDWFLPHQANARLVEAASAGLGIAAGRTLGHIERYGNTSAASLPILLHESAAEGRFRDGDLLLLAAVAAGRTSAAAVVRW